MHSYRLLDNNVNRPISIYRSCFSQNLMGLKTIAAAAKAGTKSIKATIPEGIVEYLGLQAGDEVEWKMENLPDGTRIAMMRKAAP
jgi:hypothetical protein